MTKQSFIEVKDTVLPYRLYMPTPAPIPAPLILFLHGSGERGDDLAAVAREGLPELLEHAAKQAFILAPQCPADKRWTDYLDPLLELLDEVQAGYPTTPQKLYLTGLSLGGEGVWRLAALAPQRFAALVPVCGRSNPADAERIAHIPTWIFHGSLDAQVPVTESTRMITALEAAGGAPKATLYDDLGHHSWQRAYGSAALYPWLFGQELAG